MFGVGGGSEAISRDMDNLLFTSDFKHASEGEYAKSKEQIPSDPYSNHQQQQQSSIMRYRSAPSSFFANLIEGNIGDDENGCDDFLSPLSSSPEPERFFTRQSDSRDFLQYPPTMKQEQEDSVSKQDGYSDSAPPMVYNSPQVLELPNHNSLSGGSAVNLETSFRVMNSTSSNLIRQSSSPAGFLSNLTVENGIAVMRDVGKGSSSSRLNNHLNFSSGPSSCSRFMPQIVENGNDESIAMGSPKNGQLGNGNDTSRCYSTSNRSDSWNDSTFSGLKRNRDGDLKMLSSLNGLDTQNGGSGHYTPGLVHHLSLPKTSSEMAAVEKFLQFQQESVPCKIRAKRGYATHPRSIAERVRRTRISERMRKLQELFPNMDKQTNTADMLDLAVEHIKDLQKELQTLTDTRSRCTCSSSSKQKQSSPTT